jgi:hypothetical protein
MKNLKRGSVLGGIIVGLVLVCGVEAKAQGNGKNGGHSIGTTSLSFDYDWGGLTALRTYVTSLITQIEQSKVKIAQLEAALNNEISARQAGDAALQSAINGISGGGVTQAALDAAIASEAAARAAADTAEANTRATADAALEGQIANEAAAREALAETVADLETAVAPLASLSELAPLADYVSVSSDPINGLAGPHVIFHGANVHIQSGSGDSLIKNGRGNLIVGYNELYHTDSVERGGSHNVVIGLGHRYDFETGLVAGYVNRLGHQATSVTGGGFNDTSEFAASVTGGSNNNASGPYSTVTAGDMNVASGANAAVNGGSRNTASHDLSAVSGGLSNTTTGVYSVVP